MAIAVVQRYPLEKSKLNVVGEEHDESDKRREQEKRYSKKEVPGGGYWGEPDFPAVGVKDRLWSLKKPGPRADPEALRFDHAQAFLTKNGQIYKSGTWTTSPTKPNSRSRHQQIQDQQGFFETINSVWERLEKTDARLATQKLFAAAESRLDAVIKNFDEKHLADYVAALDAISKARSVKPAEKLNQERSAAMHQAAQGSDEIGVWKIGESHRVEIEDLLVESGEDPNYHLVSQMAFDLQFPEPSK